MRAETNKRGIAILVAAGLSIAIGVVCVSTVDHRKTPAGSGQLVSVQELGQMCLGPPAESDQVREASDSNLFAPFEETLVYAAGQEGGQTVELNRQPLRYLKDLDPIYSYVTVDTRRDEVFLQDANTWSIRVFNRLENTPATAARWSVPAPFARRQARRERAPPSAPRAPMPWRKGTALQYVRACVVAGS